MSSSKIGRNQPCVCGSGRKYRKCCLSIAYPINASPRQPKLVGSFVGKQFHVHPDYGPKNVSFAELVAATGAFRLDLLLGEIRRSCSTLFVDTRFRRSSRQKNRATSGIEWISTSSFPSASTAIRDTDIRS